MNLISLGNVYAYVQDKWRKVIGLSLVGAIVLEMDDGVRAFPANDSYTWDLLWP
jgi:hypothetical protein